MWCNYAMLVYFGFPAYYLDLFGASLGPICCATTELFFVPHWQDLILSLNYHRRTHFRLVGKMLGMLKCFSQDVHPRGWHESERLCASQSVKSANGFGFLGSNWHAKGWASSKCQANPFSWWRVCGCITQASACQNSIKFDTVWCHIFARLIQALGEQVVLQRLPGENCHKLWGLGHSSVEPMHLLACSSQLVGVSSRIKHFGFKLLPCLT